MSYYDTDGDGAYDTAFLDTDFDGDVETALVDSDADGYFEVAAFDTDGDGLYDVAQADTDGDGAVNVGIVDADEDGVSEAVFGTDASVPGLSDGAVDPNQQLVDDATAFASHTAQTDIFAAQTEITTDLAGP